MLQNNIKDKILSKDSRYSKDKLLGKFATYFYRNVSLVEEKFCNKDTLFEIASLSFKVFKDKKPGTPNIEIHDCSEFKALKDSCDTLIVIANDDMPFLVDSMTELLAKRKFKIKHMINGLFASAREKNGTLKDIADNAKFNESVICFHISHITTEEKAKKLKKELEKTLSHVRHAVSDWSTMVEKLTSTIGSCVVGSKQVCLDENQAFLEWLRNDNFTFTGFGAYTIDTSSNKITCLDDSLGVVKLEYASFNKSIIEDVLETNDIKNDQLVIGKIREVSLVHRYSSLDYICLVLPDVKSAKKLIAYVFVGLFTTRLDHQSVKSIPIIRKKVDAILDRAGFDRRSFHGKELFSIIETLPKEELFQLSENELFTTSMRILSCINNPSLLLFTRKNKCNNFVNVMVFFQRSRISLETMEIVENIIKKHFSGKFIYSILKFSSLGLVYIHIAVKVKNNTSLDFDIAEIEEELDAATSKWNENLDSLVERSFDHKYAGYILENYKKAFSVSYHYQFSIEEAVDDIIGIEALMNNEQRHLFLLHSDLEAGKNHFQLKTYTFGEKIQLYKLMPILENLGFSTLEENVFEIKVKNHPETVWLQNFSLLVDDQHAHKIEDIKTNVEEAIVAIYEGKIKNDHINKLVLKAGLHWRDVFLLSAYCKYLLQIKFAHSQDFIKDTLIKNTHLTQLIIELFYGLFDPVNRDVDVKNIQTRIKSSLGRVVNSTEDRVLHKMVELVENTLRTNYFQKTIDCVSSVERGTTREYVSFKINSHNIEGVPLPKPYAEIFVYSKKMEGLHLRGGKISRGGIRWSDRVDDYRTEVLGLMKAQMTKNTIIVPDGSKGGFLVKYADLMSKEEFLTAGIEAYKTFLRGMLDITDNIVKGKVKKPFDVVCLDGDDPYLVVAADKGTATFSDIANSVSKEYNFWLGDAFASGGSVGYDHKKMGITAKGSWLSVIEHLSKVGIDPAKDVFTATGIGDMSGDVFGNGMLLSNKMKLIAAFNHIHIFLDPSPDPASSYKERKRLFELPRSNWTDYNSKLISAGGGVFDRSAKSIKLSKEIRQVLGIDEDKVDPDSLIKHILTAKVDLLWNGGIGTYVKSSTEHHEEIGNKSNDSVRVNGADLRCRVVGEGGNLGFTQLGRIEYAFNGGLLNTDFIDNSAGVDCSDHEVNIKIAFGHAVQSGKLTFEARNKLLAEMEDEVAKLVLQDNYIQNQTISISTANGVKNFESYIKLIKVLEAKADLDTALEYLPNKAELAKRMQEHTGFTRPEVCVLMAYSKRCVYDRLIDSVLPDDAYYEPYLLNYFPTKMHNKFREEILSHQLRREIVATIVTNDIVNHVGNYFFHIAQEYTGLQGCDVARAYSIVWDIFKLSELWDDISEVKDNNTRIQLFIRLRLFLQTAIFWFLRNKPQPLDVRSIIEEYKAGVLAVMSKIGKSIKGVLKQEHDRTCQNFTDNGVASHLASRVASLQYLYSAMDIVTLSNKSKCDILDVTKLYFNVGEDLHYNWLKSKVGQLPEDGYWKRMLIKSIKDDVYDQQRELSKHILSIDKDSDIETKTEKWLERNHKKVKIFNDFIGSIKSLDDLDSAKLVVAVRQSSILIH